MSAKVPDLTITIFSAATFAVVLVCGVLVYALTGQTGYVGALLVAVLASICAALVHHFWLGAVVRIQHDNETTESTETDTVSGVLSLRSLTISLLESMALAERYNRELTMVQIVIDEFDSVQSRFGSSGVDAAIALLGTTIRDAVRMPDRVGRYAPNSFILVLPETDQTGARQFSERIRRLIVEQEIRSDKGERFSISVSCGVAGFESGDDPHRLIERAERALQEAQSMGGNRSVIYSKQI